jgi:hypothetical protein
MSMATDLNEAFEMALVLFNNADYEKLAEQMHSDIVFKRVDDPDSIVGIGNVQVYFKARMLPQKPQLQDIKDKTFYPRDARHATNGQVSGTAYYQDNKSGGPIHIRFTFTFVRKTDSEDWLLINGFAAPIG